MRPPGMPGIFCRVIFVDALHKSARIPLYQPRLFPYNADKLSLEEEGMTMIWGKWLLLLMLAGALLWTAAGQARDRQEVLQVFQPATEPAQTQSAPEKSLEFPVVVRSTGLIVQNLVNYEGVLLESDSEEPAGEIMALMVYNSTDQMILSAELQLQQQERELRFLITWLPPHSRLLVVEQRGQAYENTPVTRCSCLALKTREQGKPSVEVLEVPAGLSVKNLGETTARQVLVHYKQYIPQGDFYLGGITKTAEILGLQAGESRDLLPPGYAPGYSRVVAVETT